MTYPAITKIARGFITSLITCILAVSLSGCGYFVTKATKNLADNLSQSMLDSDDPATVEQGLPAYLLLLDGLLRSDPDNTAMLAAAAELNGAYAGVFANDETQAKKLTAKSLEYARRNFCLKNARSCNLEKMSFEEFEARVPKFSLKDIDALYILASSWTSWIDTHSEDWNAVAEMSRAQLLMEKVVALNPNYGRGNPYIYLGSLATILPPALGGKPEVGQRYFERAITISEGKNLIAKVTYARRYARLVFERDLHDRLLTEVLAANPQVEGLTLVNTLAQREAEQLLDSADEYF